MRHSGEIPTKTHNFALSLAEQILLLHSVVCLATVSVFLDLCISSVKAFFHSTNFSPLSLPMQEMDRRLQDLSARKSLFLVCVDPETS